MKRKLNTFILATALALAAGGSAHAAAVSFGATGYAENFDSMGSGTTPPSGWVLWTGNSGTSNTTWSTSITANGSNSVASMVATTGALTKNDAPTATNNNGYNAAKPGNTADRILATSPTTTSGAALDLTLANATGSAINILSLSYDIQRYTATGTANELPGYQLFYMVDNTGVWNNVAALNPVLSGSGVVVPNTIGVTSVSNAPVNLATTWLNGQNLTLRWVDDNAVQTSPDQIVGLNNVSITNATPTPIPAAAWLLGFGLMGLAGIRTRKK